MKPKGKGEAGSDLREKWQSLGDRRGPWWGRPLLRTSVCEQRSSSCRICRLPNCLRRVVLRNRQKEDKSEGTGQHVHNPRLHPPSAKARISGAGKGAPEAVFPSASLEQEAANRARGQMGRVLGSGWEGAVGSGMGALQICRTLLFFLSLCVSTKSVFQRVRREPEPQKPSSKECGCFLILSL